MTSFDNNKDKVCLLLKDDVGNSRIRSHSRLHNLESCDHDIIIAFFFGVSFNKQVIVKSYLQLVKKPLNPIRETREKLVLLLMQENF